MSKIATCHDVSKATTIDMVLSESGTDWVPELVPAHAGGFAAKGFKAIVNPSNATTLGFVTGRYRTNDHTEQLRALQPLLDDGTITPARVSVWDSGGLMAFQFRCNGLETEIADGRAVSSLLTLAFTHNGRGSDFSFFSDINWFCTNQLGRVSAAVEESGDRVRHRAFIREQYAELVANQVAGMLGSSAYRFSRMRRMSERWLIGAGLISYFRTCLGLHTENYTEPTEPKALTALIDAYNSDDAGSPGTVWHAYNGVTKYLTHVQGRSEEVRSHRVLLGTGVSDISRAWELANHLAG